MVLNSIAGIGFPKTQGCERGVTLLELIVSIALSSLVAAMAFAFFKDAGKVSRLTQDRRDAGFESSTVFNSLCDNLLAGKGVLELGKDKLVLVNSGDVQLDYHWADSTLTINSKQYDFRLSDMQIVPIGPDRPKSKGGTLDGTLPWDLDSLDSDRDGHLDFKELDHNRDGILDPEEGRLVALFHVTLIIVDHGVPMTLDAVIHPRNHLIALQETRRRVAESNFW